MPKKRAILLLVCFSCILTVANLSAQTPAKFSQRFGFNQSLYMVDTPTAGLLDMGVFDMSIRMYANGGLLGRFHIGLSEKVMFGVSFGGENIIGEGPVRWNPQPGVNIRWRLKDEDYNVPAVVLGFDTQGYGAFIEKIDKPVLNEFGIEVKTVPVEIKRYAIKSRGFFAVFSKNYTFFNNFRNNFGVHVGINYSLETKDKDKDFTVFTGFDLRITDELTILGDYDFATNDDEKDAFGQGKGYLNAAARWYFMRDFYLQFAMKNILENKENINEPIRELKIVYVRSIFAAKQ